MELEVEGHQLNVNEFEGSWVVLVTFREESRQRTADFLREALEHMDEGKNWRRGLREPYEKAKPGPVCAMDSIQYLAEQNRVPEEWTLASLMLNNAAQSIGFYSAGHLNDSAADFSSVKAMFETANAMLLKTKFPFNQHIRFGDMRRES